MPLTPTQHAPHLPPQALVQGGADVNAVDEEGRTPLLLAVSCSARASAVVLSLRSAEGTGEKLCSGSKVVNYAIQSRRAIDGIESTTLHLAHVYVTNIYGTNITINL